MLSGTVIDIEVDILKGLRAFSIVGLGDKSVEEAKDRIASAIKNSGFRSPKNKSEKVVISLAPADLKKNGTQFDVAMALAYLKAVKNIDFDCPQTCFFGELSLNGDIRPIQGILPLIRFAKEKGFTEIFVPKENAKEAALVDGIKIFGADSLLQIIKHIQNPKKEFPNKKIGNLEKLESFPVTKWKYKRPETLFDISDIKGQEHAKRGLLIAAAGGHNIVLYGPPGTGKTMLGKAFTSILPPLSTKDAFDVTSIHGISGQLRKTIITHPPFRSPHHTSSFTSIIGGGAIPKPGEITLAHKGVLFLDELPEFERRIIDGLRQPLEDKAINITRVGGTQKFPTDFILFATMNPCPCGFYGSNKKECICAPHLIQNYQKKISGPIIDRIDIWIEVSDVKHESLLEKPKENDGINLTKNSNISLDPQQTKLLDSQDFQRKVIEIRKIQSKRYNHETTNASISAKQITESISLEKDVRKILDQAGKNLNLSARSYYKTIRLARTIADLESEATIKAEHILEALQYRPKGE